MAFCSLNLSIGVLCHRPTYFVEVNKNKLNGILGVILDRLLVHKNQR